MGEKPIRRAAQEAITDLGLECEVVDVCRSRGGDEWCVQFSGDYGQFCDQFRDQFERDNSAPVVREKLKRHLLKQVDKLRRAAGKFRRPKTKVADAPRAESALLSAPLKAIEGVLDAASQFAGNFLQQATGVAQAAGQTVANMSAETGPVTVKLGSQPRAEVGKPRQRPARKSGQTKKATKSKTVKTARKTTIHTSRQSKKAGKAAAKSGGKARKASAKRKAK